MKRSELWQRIRAARKKAKVSQQTIADACNPKISRNAVSLWESNDPKTRTEPKLDNLKVVSKVTEVSLDMLMSDRISVDDILQAKQNLNVEETNHASRGLAPEISYVQAGEFSEAVDIYEPGYAERWHPTVKGGSHVYVLRVSGNSMTSPTGKSFPEGMLIHVDPDRRTPENGQYIIAKVNGDNGVTFKQFKQGESKPYLQPLNPDHPVIYDKFRVLGTVVFAGWDL